MQAFSLIQLLPVLAGAFYAAASLTTRRYCAQESPYTLSMAYFGMIGLIGFLWALALDLGDVSAAGKAAFLLRGLVWPGPEICFWVAVMTGLSVLGILMITKAYQMAETSYMSIFEYSYLISAGIIGWLLWGNIFRTGEFVGMGLIVAAGLLVALSAARISEQALNEASSKTS
jgi:drug/metabolite transporter (DMT)-like permease